MAAGTAAGGLLYFHPVDLLTTAVNVFVAAALLTAAIVAAMAICRAVCRPKPEDQPTQSVCAGRWPAFSRSRERSIWARLLLIPLFLLLVSGGATLRAEGRPLVLIADSTIQSLEASPSLPVHIAAVCLKEVSKPAGVVLVLAGFLAFGYLILETFRLERLPRHRMYVVLILTFFSVLFFAFFEQAGSSINNFTDRNVRRVLPGAILRTVTAADAGKTIRLEPTQEQLGFHSGKQMFTLTALNELRHRHGEGEKAGNRLACGPR